MFNKIYYKIKEIIALNFAKRKGIKIAKGVRFKNTAFIIKDKLAIIEIKENTIINSSNKGYHLNMFQKCKLYADKPNAVISIGKNSRIHGTCIHAQNSIIIGSNCLIAANTQIIDSNGHKLSFYNVENRTKTKDQGKPIIIEDNVWIGTNCVILGGTTIGKGSVIKAGSVVKGNVPELCIYGGNPAILIKQYNID